MAAEKGKVGWAPGAKSGSFGSIASDPWGSLMKWLESDSDQNTEWKLPEVLRESPILRDLFGWEQKDQQAGRFGMSPGDIKARNQHSLYNHKNVFSGPTPELPVDPDDMSINMQTYMATGKDLIKQEVDGLMQEGHSREDAIEAVVTNKTLTDSLYKQALDASKRPNLMEGKEFLGQFLDTVTPSMSEQYDSEGNFIGYTASGTSHLGTPYYKTPKESTTGSVLYGGLGGFDGKNPFAGMKFGNN